MNNHGNGDDQIVTVVIINKRLGNNCDHNDVYGDHVGH